MNKTELELQLNTLSFKLLSDMHDKLSLFEIDEKDKMDLAIKLFANCLGRTMALYVKDEHVDAVLEGMSAWIKEIILSSKVEFLKGFETSDLPQT